MASKGSDLRWNLHQPVRYPRLMAERIRKTSPSTHTSEDADVEAAPAAPASGLVAELDDLLSEIDEVLETNAEEFVKNYVQKGGQ